MSEDEWNREQALTNQTTGALTKGGSKQKYNTTYLGNATDTERLLNSTQKLEDTLLQQQLDGEDVDQIKNASNGTETVADNETASWDTGGQTSSKEKEKQSQSKSRYQDDEELDDSMLAGNETSDDAAFDANTIDKSETVGEDESLADDQDTTSQMKEKQ